MSSPPSRPSAATRTSDGALQRLAAGSRLAGRYRILGLLGVGGMGMVYQAHDEQLDLQIAVKVLRLDVAQDASRLERFKQELVLARQVSHPNVVRTHDLGSDGDLVFLTMDFVPGRSLGDRLETDGRMSAESAVAVARQLAAGLAVAHEAGVVHRDLKPGNVLIEDSGRAAISDFGVARSLATAGSTLPGVIVGTLDYLAPEQAGGGDVDGRADLYALGILIYEMLTGELPFAGGSTAEVFAQRLRGATRDLSKAGVKVPPRLAEIVRRLLQRDPARRYQSAQELLADLDRMRSSRRPSSRTVRRIALAACGALALLVLGWTVRERARLARHDPEKAAAVAPRHALALLPLADETGRADLAWIASGLPEMLAVSLAESRGLRVLDSRRVFATLESLKLPPGPLAEADARRLAGLLDVDRLVSGHVRTAGGRVRVDLSLTAADLPGLPAQALSTEVGLNDSFRLVEQLGALLRQRLAVAPVAAAPAVSRSPAALAAYAKGVASLLRGDDQEAATAFERAVAEDAKYSAAWVRLARAREALGRRDEAREAARRAVESLGPGEHRSTYEAQAIEARLLGRAEKAQEILGRLVERYPDDVEARVELAEAYGEQGSLDRATATLEDVVRLAPHHPHAWYLLAKYSIQAGSARRAVDDYLVHALVVQNEVGSDEGRADVLNAFGVAYRNLGEMERAVENYEQAAAIRRRIGDVRGYAITLRNVANIQIVRGELATAQRQLEEALALLEKLGDAPGLADLYNDFGVLAEERGDYEAALGHYQRALRARRDLGNDLALAQSFGNVGYSCYQLGRYDDALVYWRQALDLAKKSGDPSGVVLATQNLGLLSLARGEWDEAVKAFLSALRTSRELGMKEATAASLGHLGRLALYQGRPGAALASFAESLGVLREIDDRRGLAEFTLARSEAELELGLETVAGEHLKEAADLLRGEKSHEQQAELERLQGEWHFLRGEADQAREALRRALGHAEQSHSVVELLEVRTSAAGAALGSRQAGPVLADLERLRAQAEALGHARLRLRADAAVARAALAADRPERARQVAQAGLDLASACGGYFGAWRLQALLARALDREGRPAEAEAARARAAEEIARVSRDLAPGQRASFDRMREVREIAKADQRDAPGRRGSG